MPYGITRPQWFKKYSTHPCSVLQTARLEEVKREEFEQLETQSIPLRNYLVKHVMPTLTQALIDCCKVRPDDAIDYLVSEGAAGFEIWE